MLPPRVPGIQAKFSIPPRLFSAACSTSSSMLMPHCAVMVLPFVLRPQSFFVLITIPRIPLSDTRILAPPPRKNVGMLFFLHIVESFTSSSVFEGSANASAGPPTLKLVCLLMGSSKRIGELMLIFLSNLRTFTTGLYYLFLSKVAIVGRFFMNIRFFNSMGRSVEDFCPIDKNVVGMYACGPTVYNYAHIGNLRTYIFEDILRRTLEYAGYKVKHVMNVTDVGHLTSDGDEGEDKMIKSAREKGMSVWDIAQFFSDAFFNDIKELNILMPTVVCRATEHITDMIELVKRLEERGHTYVSEGNVYYDTSTFPDYGKLALLDRQELRAGARVAVDKSKKNPRDFVLWFTRSKFENQAMVWDSPWGRGYPGWHLECSAMSMKYLGEQFDIHCGGIDHIPVHHTNEIAQSEGATGKSPWVRYWLHGEFLVLDSGKMSKSSGNFLTLSVLKEKGFSPLDYRYYCLGAHYRSQLVFSFSALESAKNARRSLIEKLNALSPSSDWSSAVLSDKSVSYIEQFKDYISNDLNTPRAVSVLWSVLKDSSISDDEKAFIVSDMDRVLGLSLAKEIGVKKTCAELSPEDMELIKQREEFRKAKNYSEADRIRNLLAEKGIIIKDTPQGTVWEVEDFK